jgi:glycosyltransferase involved in cell wall biosynthesis
MPPSLSIIVPAYNEAARLGRTLRTIYDYLDGRDYESELIVVDDGSSDETVQVAGQHLAESARISSRVIPVRPNRGKGHAVYTGLLAARAPIALFTDADLSTPITETPTLVEPIERGLYDVTFGSRALDRGRIGVHQPWRREQGGRVFNFLVRFATGLPFWDTQCGFKAFRLSVCRPIIQAATVERFGFDVELLYVSSLAGLRLKELPVRWDHNEGSKVSVMRDSLRMFDEVRTIRVQARRGLYDAAVTAARAEAERERQGSEDKDQTAPESEMAVRQ